MKRGKTDAVDAEAICEAVTRPAMRFVPVKPAERQAALLDHKACDLLVRQRTQIVNAIRAHVGEFGVVVAKGIHNVDRLLDATRDLPDAARPAPGMLASQLCDTQARITDNGIEFANRSCDTTAFEHIFGRLCREHGIEHRLTKARHPWTNGQVERMNRTIREATVKRFHYDNHDQLRTHLADFIAAYDFARRLKTLSGLTPYEYICKIRTSEPDRFIVNPIHQMPGLNN